MDVHFFWDYVPTVTLKNPQNFGTFTQCFVFGVLGQHTNPSRWTVITKSGLPQWTARLKLCTKLTYMLEKMVVFGRHRSALRFIGNT